MFSAETYAAVLGSRSLKGALNGSSGIGRLKVIGRNYIETQIAGTPGTDYAACGRAVITTKGPVTGFRLAFFPQAVAYIARASMETQAGTILSRATLNANTDIVVPTIGSGAVAGVLSDFIGVTTPGATSVFARTHKRVPKPPAGTPTATAVTGKGSFAAAQQFYKITTFDNDLESGPSAEFTVTPSAGDAVRLDWVLPTIGTPSAYGIYRNTTTNTEQLVAKIPAGALSWTDRGDTTLNSAKTPPTEAAISFDRYPLTGESANTIYGGGTGADVTGSVGAMAGVTGPSNIYMVTPSIVLADDNESVALMCFGDSIEHGLGISNNIGSTFSRQRANWFDAGIADGQFGSLNFSVPSARISHFINQAVHTETRVWASQWSDYEVWPLGVNDVAAGRTWQQIAADHLANARVRYNRSVRYILSTLLPLVTTTNCCLTILGQTVTANEAQRTGFNTWARNGCQVDGTGTPVASGGTPSPYIYRVFDAASYVEVNASNVLTPNGGFWAVPTVLRSTGTLTGSPSTTSLPGTGTPYTASGNSARGESDYVVKITSGTRNGDTCIIRSNTTSTLTVYANAALGSGGIAVVGLGGAPSAADTYEIWETYSPEGTHPHPISHAAIAAGFATFLSANVLPYGSAGA